jgi:hypothetical protein
MPEDDLFSMLREMLFGAATGTTESLVLDQKNEILKPGGRCATRPPRCYKITRRMPRCSAASKKADAISETVGEVMDNDPSVRDTHSSGGCWIRSTSEAFRLAKETPAKSHLMGLWGRPDLPGFYRLCRAGRGAKGSDSFPLRNLS